MNSAALFSGQGSQYPGMGRELAEAYPEARRVYECAGDILGMDVLALSGADERELSRTAVAQPVIFTLSAAAYTLARDRFGEPKAVAGHSLGELAALYAAGAYSLEDGFRIVGARAEAMEQAAGRGPSGAMFAILGSTEEEIETVCRETAGLVLPVNLNLPSQTVISGEVSAAEAAAQTLCERGAKVVRLEVGSAFHTELMASAAEEFRARIANIPFSAVRLDFYSNLTGDKLVIEDYPAYFAQHMVSPVRFTAQAAAMTRDGITHLVEYGPKKTVATLMKKNNRGFSVANVEDVKSFEALAAFYTKE